MYMILEFELELATLLKQYYEGLRKYKTVIEALAMNYIDLNKINDSLNDYREFRLEFQIKIEK